MPDVQRLRQLYAKSSDADLRAALDAGEHTFEPEAWAVITSEVTQRGLDRPPPPEPEDESQDEEALDALSPRARTGRRQLHAAAVVFAIAGALSVLMAAFSLDALAILGAVLTYAMLLAVGYNVLEGRQWARLLMLALLAHRAGISLYAQFTYPGSGILAVIVAVLTMTYVLLFFTLLAAPGVRAYFRERRQVGHGGVAP